MWNGYEQLLAKFVHLQCFSFLNANNSFNILAFLGLSTQYNSYTIVIQAYEITADCSVSVNSWAK